MRRIGVVGAGVLLLLVMGALAPLAASGASSLAFTAGEYPTTVTGTSAVGNETLGTEAGTVECQTAYHAALKEPSSTLLLTPTTSSCKAFGFLNASMTTTGCAYQLHLTAEPTEDNFKSRFDIACEAGKAIKVAAGTCEIEIGPQSELNSVALANKTAASPQDITFDPEVTGIDYKVLKDGFGCPFSGTGSKTGASLGAHEPVTLSASGVAVDIG